MKEKSISIISFVVYFVISAIFMLSGSGILDFILFKLGIQIGLLDFILFFPGLLAIFAYHIDCFIWREKEQEYNKRFHPITKEIRNYIPVLILQMFISSYVIGNATLDQISDLSFINCFIMFFSAIIIAPVFEEIIFRYLPFNFIKNNFVYIIFSSFIFSFLHVVGYGKMWPFFIWNYLINSIYLGYRYSKTNDLRVTVAIHRVNNLTAFILFIISNVFSN